MRFSLPPAPYRTQRHEQGSHLPNSHSRTCFPFSPHVENVLAERANGMLCVPVVVAVAASAVHAHTHTQKAEKWSSQRHAALDLCTCA